MSRHNNGPVMLEKEELMSILTAYDNYIQTANRDNLYASGWRPVSLALYYDMFFSEPVSDRLVS